MVWQLEPAELSGPIVFRWYRSVATDLGPVTLTVHHPFAAVQLHWSPRRTAYESRPVVLPCGRYSASLRLDGADRPLAPFRVTRFTFEVLLFLSSDVADGSGDEVDLARRAAVWRTVPEWPPSPTTAAVERRHGRLVTQLAGAALLAELAADVRQLRRQSGATQRQAEQLARELRHRRLRRRLREAVRHEDEEGLEAAGPLGSDSDLTETAADRHWVAGYRPFGHPRTAVPAELSPRRTPETDRPAPPHRPPLPAPWRPWSPSELTPGQRAAVITGGQVIRGHISHIWMSAHHTLVNIETNGWEDVTVPFQKVIMVW
ncbi:hypothetical protein FJT64_006694 [Amphibalanus amphitrite]|uniref:Uncharacterized protein n=1 Tax=Amphibalanus amphitrite TaxID=1232801 RepID=A0A6A4VW33_AMPAM|nr:hypothetical protein FJT64_006694 [Amphibalanus amphitrite]